jgi:hypothetical protein
MIKCIIIIRISQNNNIRTFKYINKDNLNAKPKTHPCKQQELFTLYKALSDDLNLS